MSKLLTIARCLSAAAAACSILVAAAPAQAGVIVSFDPAFGPALPFLGFKGTMNVDVTAGCYSLGTGFQNTGGSCQITPLSAQINFYNTLDPNTTLNTVTLTAGSFGPTYVFGAYFDPLTGQLAGLDTNDSSVFNVSVASTNPLYPTFSYNESMVLFFQSGFAPPPVILFAAVAPSPSATIPGVGGAFLRRCTDSTSTQPCISGEGDTSNPGILTFTTVPEPDSIALALMGLGALVITRRRVRKSH